MHQQRQSARVQALRKQILGCELAGQMVSRWQHVSVGTCALLSVCVTGGADVERQQWALPLLRLRRPRSPATAAPPDHLPEWMRQESFVLSEQIKKEAAIERAKRSAPPGVRAARPVCTLKWSGIKRCSRTSCRVLFIHLISGQPKWWDVFTKFQYGQKSLVTLRVLTHNLKGSHTYC